MTEFETQEDAALILGSSDRIELVATILMSLAAIFTAWAAFESAKWSGIQAIDFAKAGASRTESVRYDNRAGQLAAIDIGLFTSWLEAIDADAKEGLVEISPGASIEPVPGTLSGFIFERFRDEFRPAMNAWLRLWVEDRSNAPPSPFAMEEYVLADAEKAATLAADADQFSKEAGQANQNSDNYVLTVVAFALVLFFGGVSAKLEAKRNRMITIVVASVIFIGAIIVLLSLPKIFP